MRSEVDMNDPPCLGKELLEECDESVSEFDACTKSFLEASRDLLQSAASTMETVSCDYAGQPFDAGVFTPSGKLNTGVESAGACDLLFESCPNAAFYLY